MMDADKSGEDIMQQTKYCGQKNLMLIDDINEIERLKHTPREPFRQVKMKELKKKVLELLPPGPTEINEYVVYKTSTYVPYLQIYSKKGWEKCQKIIK